MPEPVVNIAAYLFAPLDRLPERRAELRAVCAWELQKQEKTRQQNSLLMCRFPLCTHCSVLHSL
jgi:hypothetical protein